MPQEFTFNDGEEASAPEGWNPLVYDLSGAVIGTARLLGLLHQRTFVESDIISVYVDMSPRDAYVDTAPVTLMV